MYGREEMHTQGSGTEKGHLEEAGTDERIILKWTTKKQDGRVWTRLIWF
jgi:hypothetical protein